MRKFARGERGFTLIEVMVAAGLMTVVVGSLVILLSDYSKYYREAQEKNVLLTLRRRVVQALNRRDAWIITYRMTTNNFGCMTVRTANACLPGPHLFTLYSSSFPATPQSIVHSTKLRPLFPVNPSITVEDDRVGLTTRGEYCATFDEDAEKALMTAAAYANALRCPIRLELTWRLLSYGIPGSFTSSNYYPTGYFPYGYYEGTGVSGGAAYFPGIASDYWWFGTLSAQVEVMGTFKVHQESLGKSIKASNYDFKIIKEIP